MIKDNSVTIQVLGTLMKKPLTLGDTKYLITPDDFYTPFEKQIFGAIYNLYLNGMERITVIDIDSYLQSHEGIYQNFKSNNGIEYLQDCEDISVEENFEYYYNKLKKNNLLNDLEKDGISIDSIYPKDLTIKDYDKMMDRYEKMSIEDIINSVKLRITQIEANYEGGGAIQTVYADTDIDKLLESLQTTPDIGSPLQGNIYNTAVRGARLGKYFVRSADSGVGKTRSMVGDACGIAYPFRFNQELNRWEFNGASEKVLYLGTEQGPDEIQTLILSYLTGINEEKIMYGYYSAEEKIIIEGAKYIMTTFRDNFIICQIPDPDIKSVKAQIRQLVLQYDVSYVFYDYIFSSPSLMKEFRGTNLREDVVLMMMSTALKDIAVELNVFLQTSTQVTIGESEKGKMKTKASIRGAKSIADKADVGCVVSLVTQEDLNVLQNAVSIAGLVPNQVTDIYKLRRGRYNNIRIWSYFDAGTCRRKDLFVTDPYMNGITDFQVMNFQVEFENLKDLKEIKEELDNSYSVGKEENKVDTIPTSVVISEETEEVLEVIEEKVKDWRSNLW